MSRPPDIVGGRQGSTPRVAAVFDLEKGALSAVCARAPEPRARAHRRASCAFAGGRRPAAAATLRTARAAAAEPAAALSAAAEPAAALAAAPVDSRTRSLHDK